MGAVLEFNCALESLTCGECGIEWAMPRWFVAVRRENGATFYCPNGHPRVFRETEVEKLRKERDKLARRVEWAESRREAWRRESEHQERRAASYRGHLTRTKKRVANGVCPCCNRTFHDLARHMASKHPSYAADSE